jgi:hypothetical protein
MHRILLILLFLFAGSHFSAVAQPKRVPPNAPRVEEAKRNFMINRLGLTETEAQRFWPVYQRYTEELRQIQKERNTASRTAVGDNDAYRDLQFEERILTLKKRYRKEFIRVIPLEKAVMIHQAEREFTAQLLRQLKKNRQG